jgi:hypothetical protein
MVALAVPGSFKRHKSTIGTLYKTTTIISLEQLEHLLAAMLPVLWEAHGALVRNMAATPWNLELHILPVLLRKGCLEKLQGL